MKEMFKVLYPPRKLLLCVQRSSERKEDCLPRCAVANDIQFRPSANKHSLQQLVQPTGCVAI